MTLWSYYEDAAGNRAVLTVEVERRHVLLTTAAGEVLRLTPTELGMLLENLESAADYCVKRNMPPE